MAGVTVYPENDEYGNFINVPTWYAHWGRQWKKAIEDIEIYGRFVNPDYVGPFPAYLPTYIEQLHASREYYVSAGLWDKVEEVDEKIVSAEERYPVYLEKYEAALVNKPFFENKLIEIEEANEMYRTVKYDDSLYIVDRESAVLYNSRKNPSIDSASGEMIGKEVNMLTDNATDATRIWTDGSSIINCTINDLRPYNAAHRDGIQLIPPPQADYTREGTDGGPWRMGDQTVGAALYDATVKNNIINAPEATMQGIFASDGFFRNLKIINNSITTAGYHAITINGFLNGEISGNHINQTGLFDYKPAIYVNSGRVGGNMADDGMVSILSFQDENYNYDPIIVNSPNTAIINGVSQELEITDNRGLIPCEFKKLAVGIEDFHFTEYYDYYNNLTIGDYKVNHPKEYHNMKNWLLTRIADYDPANPRKGLMPYMPDASPEQINLIRPYLIFAYTNLENGSIDHLRIPELAETAIRSFVTKQMALLFGRIKPLYDIGEIFNIRRYNYLKFLLDEEWFLEENFIVNETPCPGEKGWVDPDDENEPESEDSRNIDLIDINTHLPQIGIPFILVNKNTGFTTKGFTNSNGTIDFKNVPPGEYSLTILGRTATFLREV